MPVEFDKENFDYILVPKRLLINKKSMILPKNDNSNIKEVKIIFHV